MLNEMLSSWSSTHVHVKFYIAIQIRGKWHAYTFLKNQSRDHLKKS